MDYDVLEARHVRDHVVWVRCRDGTSGEVDLSSVLRGPIFEPLQDVDYFRQFVLDPTFHTLTWPNGADVAPEYLHDSAVPQTRSVASEPRARWRGSLESYRQELQHPPHAHLGESDDSGVRDAALQEFPDGTKSDGSSGVPRISSFYGIVITMYHREHGGPHFHASYGGRRVSVDIRTGALRGKFPPGARRMVLEWLSLHQRELLENWELAQRRQLLRAVAPLE